VESISRTTEARKPSVMESELKSLQSKILDLESKLNFTHNEDAIADEEFMKDGVTGVKDPFKSIDERQEFGQGRDSRKGSLGGHSAK